MVKPWGKATIGEFLDFKNGLNKGREFFGYGTPIINYTDVYNKRGLYASDIKGRVELTSSEIQRFDVKRNDVFFTRTSETPDEVGLSSVLLEDIDDCSFSGFILRGRPKNQLLLPEYCKYCFSTKAVRNAIIQNCTYTTRALTNGRQLSAIEIPVPSADEQEAISQVLTDVDILIENLGNLIKKRKAIKQGAMHELLSGKIRLPGYESDWTEIEMAVLGEFKSGSCFPLDKQGKQGEKLPFYKVSDFNIKGNERVMYDANNTVSFEISQELGCTIIPANSIIFAKIGAAIMLERKRLTSRDSCIDNNMMALIPYEKYSASFICYLLQTVSFSSLATATALPSLSPYSIGEVKRRIPKSKKEQESISEILEEMDIEIEALEAKYMKYKAIKQGMMSELLTGKIRLV